MSYEHNQNHEKLEYLLLFSQRNYLSRQLKCCLHLAEKKASLERIQQACSLVNDMLSLQAEPAS